jgi:hypothetical protein
MKRLLIIGLFCGASYGVFASHPATVVTQVKHTVSIGPDSLKCPVAPPATLTVVTAGYDFVEITWSVSPGAFKYRVNVMETDRQIQVRSFYTTENTVRIEGLLGATVYTFGVSATACD